MGELRVIGGVRGGLGEIKERREEDEEGAWIVYIGMSQAGWNYLIK